MKLKKQIAHRTDTIEAYACSCTCLCGCGCSRNNSLTSGAQASGSYSGNESGTAAGYRK